MGKNTSTQIIELELEDSSILKFNIERDDYIKFINETKPNNKFDSMHNFLMRTIDDDSRDTLRKLLENPANTTELVGEVLEEYTPDIKVVVKKRKRSVSKSS